MSIIIRLQNLPWSANSVDIRRYFSGLSIPEGGVHIVGGEMGDSFIAFSTDEDARLAMAKDGGKIKDMQIKLLLSSRTEMMRVIEQARTQNVVAAAPVLIPPPAPFMAMQPPLRIPPTPVMESSDRKRERSPSPHRRSRDRSPSRDRYRSPDRRSSRRDRSRSPRSNRGPSRDTDRRNDRFKRDDRRYEESSRYRDDYRASRDHSSEAKKYQDADHVNSRSQLHATEGFRTAAPTPYEAVPPSVPAQNYSYNSDHHPVVSKSFPSDSFPASRANSSLSHSDRLGPSAENVTNMGDQRNSPMPLTHGSQRQYDTLPFGQMPPSVKDDSQSSSAGRRRKSRFEPDYGQPPTEPRFFQRPEVSRNTGSSEQSREQQYNEKRMTPVDYLSGSTITWSRGIEDPTQNTWGEKRPALLQAPSSTKEDFVQVVPMDLDPIPDGGSEIQSFMPPEATSHPSRAASSFSGNAGRKDVPASFSRNNAESKIGNSRNNLGPGLESTDKYPEISRPNSSPRSAPNERIEGSRTFPRSNTSPKNASNDRSEGPRTFPRNTASLRNEDIDRGTNRRGPPRNEDLDVGSTARGPPRNEDINRGTNLRRPPGNEDLNRGSNLGGPSRNEDLDRGGNIRRPPRNEDLDRGTDMRGPPRNEDLIRGTSVRGSDRNEDFDNRKNMRGPGRNEDMDRGTNIRGSARNEDLNRGTNMREPPRNEDFDNRTNMRGPPRSEDLKRDTNRRGPPGNEERDKVIGMRDPPRTEDLERETGRRGPSRFESEPHDSPSLTVEIKGIPSSTRAEDILEFFHDIPLSLKDVRILTNPQGAEKVVVRFATTSHVKQAFSRNNRFHGGRFEMDMCPDSIFESLLKNSNQTVPSQRPKLKPMPCEEDLCIQMRGLPFQCKEDDIVRFFDGLGILDIFVAMSPSGRAAGFGFVEFGTPEDFRAALAMNGKMIGHRYITISVASKEMMEIARADAGHTMPATGEKSAPIMPAMGKPGRPPPPPCISLRGLPDTVTNREIANFFNQVGVMPRAIHIMLTPDKKPSGDAFAELAGPKDVAAALSKDGDFVLGNPVEVTSISFREMAEILGRPVPPMPPPPTPGPLLRTPGEGERPRRPMLFQGPNDGNFRERPRMEPPNRGMRPRMEPPMRRMDAPGRPPFNRMRGPWPPRPFGRGPDSRFPPPSSGMAKEFSSPGCVVSINNLHFRAGLEELLEFFMGFNVTKDTIIRKYNENGQATGEARVAFQNPREAQQAVRELNQKPIMGRPLALSIL